MRIFDSRFCHSSLGRLRIAMHIILVEMFRNLILLINNPLKRGDVETLARSSVSPPPQVKMTFKLTSSR